MRQIGLHHFAYLRAVAEGLDIAESAARYLGTEDDYETCSAHSRRQQRRCFRNADLQTAIDNIINSGKNTVNQRDRQAVVNVVVSRSRVIDLEAKARVNGWIKTY